MALRLVHLVGIKDEVLAQHGRGAGSAGFLDGRQVLRLALKAGVGQHGNGRGSVFGVGAGQLYWVKVGAEQTPGGRGLFDFGN